MPDFIPAINTHFNVYTKLNIIHRFNAYKLHLVFLHSTFSNTICLDNKLYMIGMDTNRVNHKHQPKKSWIEEINGILIARRLKDCQWGDRTECRNKIGITFIFRLQRRPIQLVV